MKQFYKIAFTGKMGAGKTSASLLALGLLADKYGQEDAVGFVIKFANPLHACAIAFHRKEKPRVFLQRLGDLARREFGDDIFEQIFKSNVDGLINIKAPEIKQNHILIMTDDLRFLGEYHLVKELGFTVIRIDSDEEQRKQWLGNAYMNVRHRSEMEMEQFEPDFVITNNILDPHMADVENQLRVLFQQHGLMGV